MQPPASRSLIVLALFTLTSCATILNRRTYDMVIKSSHPGDKAEINRVTYNLPTAVTVIRSKAPLTVKLISDSTEVNYQVLASKHSPFYFNFFSPWFLGFLVDLTNEKRFTYGRDITLNRNDTAFIRQKPYHTPYFQKKHPTYQGDINWTFSLPFVNSFNLQPDGELAKSNTGFLGISTGIEYYYRDKKFINVRADAVMDFDVPIPVPVDYVGMHESMSSFYVSLTDNFVLNRFTLGYGVNFGSNSWALSEGIFGDTIPETRQPAFKRSWSAGLTLNAYHQLTKLFFVGVIYRPSILRTSPAVEFKYEHLVTVDLLWKIPMRRKDEY